MSTVQNREVSTFERFISSKNSWGGQRGVHNTEVSTLERCPHREVLLYFIKNNFSSKFDRTPPQHFCSQFCAVVPHDLNFDEKYFLIKHKFFDVIFYGDSEYHVYFVFKPTFDSQNLEILVQFFNLLPPISK